MRGGSEPGPQSKTEKEADDATGVVSSDMSSERKLREEQAAKSAARYTDSENEDETPRREDEDGTPRDATGYRRPPAASRPSSPSGSGGTGRGSLGKRGGRDSDSESPSDEEAHER